MAQQLAPFRSNTRQRFRIVGTVTPSVGSQVQVTFPQVGLLSRIFLYINGTVTDAAASPSVAASTFGPFNFLKRITGFTNLGTATVFDLSGYGAYLVSKVTDTCVELKAAAGDQASPDPFYNYPVTGFTQNVPKAVQFCLMIPVTYNDGDNFSAGLINLQAPEIRFTLQLTFTSTPAAAAGSIADVYVSSDTQTIGGTVEIAYEYYEVPDPTQVQLPPRVMHRLLEDRFPILATGDTTYTVPRQGIVLQILHNIILNGVVDKAGNTNVASQRLVLNKTDTPYQLNWAEARIWSRYRYGLAGGTTTDLPGGMYVWDFAESSQAPTRGDLRDAVDSEALATLESIITLNAGVTGPCFIDTVRRILQSY